MFGSVSSARNGAWLVLLAAVCWGTTGTAQAFAPDGATPLAVGAVRLAIGGAALLVWALARRSFQPRRRWPIGATLSAAACMALYQLCFFAAVDRTGVAAGTVVAIGSGPVIAGLISWLALRESPALSWMAATLLATTGCVLLGLSGGSVTIDPVGILLAIAAGASYAIYVFASKGLVGAQRPEAAMGVVFALGALMLAPLFFMQEFGWLAQPRGLVVALHLGIVTTAFAYALFAEALTTTPVATAVTLTLGEPLTATLLGVLLLRESLNGMAMSGLLLLLIGLVVLALASRRADQALPAVDHVAL
jgi:DME family drug/metabolite transporter